MPDDLRHAVKALGRQPRTQLDVDRLWTRGRRRRMVTNTATGTAVVAVAAALVVAGPKLLDQQPATHVPVVTAIGLEQPVASPDSADATPGLDGTAWRSWHINGYGLRLPIPEGWSLEPGQATTWQGGGGELSVSAGVSYVIDDAADLERHCRDEAAAHPGLMQPATLEMRTIAGQTGCLAISHDRQSFVAIVQFPPEAQASNTSDLVLVGHGVDAHHLLDRLRFEEAR